MADTPDLVSHARESRVVVIGAGLAGLVAALECARVGISVTVLEAETDAGGTLRSTEIDGVPVATVADGFAVTDGELARLIDELELRADVVPAREQDTWVAGPHGVAPLPAEHIVGIPANPFSDRARRILGWGGAWRAYVDRLRPPLTVGKERSLGRLVRTRMGDRVADRMVAPLAYGIHAIDPDRVDADLAAPGLNAALTRTGSLSGAVGQLLPDGPAPVRRATIAGGVSRLAAALVARLGEYDVDVRTGVRVTRLGRSHEGWTVTADGADPLVADAVIVAVPEAEARRLLAPHVPGVEEAPEGPGEVEVVTLLVDAPALDAVPRGHGVYAVPGQAPAVAVLHATATWPHTAGDPHVVRVVRPADAQTDAAADAAALLGTGFVRVRGEHRVHRSPALPASAMHTDRAAVLAAVASAPGLGVCGGWVAGSGLARVADQAQTEAERVRAAVLWGPGGEDAAP